MKWEWLFLIILVICTTIAEIFDSYFNYKSKQKKEEENNE